MAFPRRLSASLVLWLAIVAWAARATTAFASPPDATPLDGLSFLLGEWVAGANAGAHGSGSGNCAFRKDIQGRVIVRTNHAEYPAAGGKPAIQHDDLMVIYAAESGPEAHFYDGEGHMIHYRISVPESGHAVFLSDPATSAPRFRLSYRLRDDQSIGGEFEIAPPGHPDDFKQYLAWEMRRGKP